jgi:hypothetical protein
VSSLPFRRHLLIAVLFSAGCGRHLTDAELVSQDKQILADFAAIQARFNANQISRAEFISGLQKLQGREEKVFTEARRHRFTDQTSRNYFYGMRLKFPSPISETLNDVR